MVRWASAKLVLPVPACVHSTASTADQTLGFNPAPAGPPAHIPGPPAPRPASLDTQAAADAADSDDSDAGEDDEAAAARQEWEAGERRRLDLPRLVLLRTQSNQ